MSYFDNNLLINADCTDILLEFLEVAFYSILHTRKLYPKEIFTQRTVRGVSVHVSVYPALTKYIQSILNSIKEIISIDVYNVKHVNLVFLNEAKVPVEKFVIPIDEMRNHIFSKTDLYFKKIENSIRNLLLSLSASICYLQPLPLNSTFRITIATHSTDNTVITKNAKFQDFPWEVRSDTEVKNGLLLPMSQLSSIYLVSKCASKHNT